MTDVVHHVPDLGQLFLELNRVLKSGALLCIVTESHEQIHGRFYNRYFPSLEDNERKRYPDLSKIIETAKGSGFLVDDIKALQGTDQPAVTEHFIRTVEEKNFSMFRNLEIAEFNEGLKKLKLDLGKSFECGSGGETLLWLKKAAKFLRRRRFISDATLHPEYLSDPLPVGAQRFFDRQCEGRHGFEALLNDDGAFEWASSDPGIVDIAIAKCFAPDTADRLAQM